MTETTLDIPQTPARAAPSLLHLPVGLFAVGMGGLGLGLAWRKAAEALPQVPALGVVAEALLVLAFAGLGMVALAYAGKWARQPSSVTAEFAHPVAANFFPATSVSLILLASAFLPYSRPLAQGLWVGGVILHFALTLVLAGRWLDGARAPGELNPSWFIPVVGNIVAPLLGVKLGFRDLSWFLFAVGFAMWVPLFAMLMHRLVFLPPLPARLTPTLFILIAPPAIGSVAYTGLAGGLDPFGRGLFHFGLFLALLLAARPGRFMNLPFAPSWWAYTFPLDALALSAFVYREAGGALPLAVPLALLGVATLVVGLVAVRTVRSALSGALLLPPHG